MIDPLVEALLDDPVLQEAANIAHMFHIDPLVVLDERDDFRSLVRHAAARHINAQQREQAEQMKKK